MQTGNLIFFALQSQEICTRYIIADCSVEQIECLYRELDIHHQLLIEGLPPSRHGNNQSPLIISNDCSKFQYPKDCPISHLNINIQLDLYNLW